MTEDERGRRLSRRAVLAGLGTVAAIGAGFVAIPLLRNGPVAGVAGPFPTGPFPTGAVGSSGNLRAAMLVGPGWLPDGFVEVGRKATLGDPCLVRHRVWLRDPRQPQTGAVVMYLFPPEAPKAPQLGDPDAGA